MTEEQKRVLRWLLDLCDLADAEGDGTLSTSTVRRIVNEALS